MTTSPIDARWLASQFPDLRNLAPLSRGGQKLVFAASHPADGDVVLKVIRPPVDIEAVGREILAVKEVSSTRVPRILADGRLSSPLGECYWFREQRVMGDTVRARIRNGPFNPALLLHLGVHTLEALVATEAVQIVHRDVKPDNIVCDPDDEFWLLDFGVARHLQLSSQTPTAAPFGKYTPGYGPPEQFRNIKSDIDARSDLFACGVTLYECATGQNPFRHGANNNLEVLHRVERMPLSPLNLSFPGADDFADLVSAMVQKRRDHRPQTAKEALEWIEEIQRRNEDR